MAKTDTLPEIQQIVGAILFAAREPVSADQMLRIFKQTAEKFGAPVNQYGKVTKKQIEDAVENLRDAVRADRTGFSVSEVAGGYRLENDASCGPWIRVLLDRTKVQRLSKPSLETLAIIAYRQPCTRSDIEQIRGVAVDQIVRNLLEMQLIRIVGRSELPGRPWLFGTTQRFLEHFGLRSLDDMPSREDLRRYEQEAAEHAEKNIPGETDVAAETGVEEETEEGAE